MRNNKEKLNLINISDEYEKYKEYPKNILIKDLEPEGSACEYYEFLDINNFEYEVVFDLKNIQPSTKNCEKAVLSFSVLGQDSDPIMNIGIREINLLFDKINKMYLEIIKEYNIKKIKICASTDSHSIKTVLNFKDILKNNKHIFDGHNIKIENLFHITFQDGVANVKVKQNHFLYKKYQINVTEDIINDLVYISKLNKDEIVPYIYKIIEEKTNQKPKNIQRLKLYERYIRKYHPEFDIKISEEKNSLYINTNIN